MTIGAFWSRSPPLLVEGLDAIGDVRLPDGEAARALDVPVGVNRRAPRVQEEPSLPEEGFGAVRADLDRGLVRVRRKTAGRGGNGWGACRGAGSCRERSGNRSLTRGIRFRRRGSLQRPRVAADPRELSFTRGGEVGDGRAEDRQQDQDQDLCPCDMSHAVSFSRSSTPVPHGFFRVCPYDFPACRTTLSTACARATPFAMIPA